MNNLQLYSYNKKAKSKRKSWKDPKEQKKENTFLGEERLRITIDFSKETM